MEVAADAAAVLSMASKKAYDLYLLDADILASPAAASTTAAVGEVATAPGGSEVGRTVGTLIQELRGLEATAGRKEAPMVGISGRAAVDADSGLVEAMAGIVNAQ